MPTISETTTVRVANTRSARRQLDAERAEQPSIPSASRTPNPSPMSEARSPITSDSRITEARIWRRDAPIVRSVANSRVRCATVIEKVLKMTNAPTKSAIAAKVSRK